MTDREWARAFVNCEIAGTGRRFNQTVDVLVKKLEQARQEGAVGTVAAGVGSASGGPPHPSRPAG